MQCLKYQFGIDNFKKKKKKSHNITDLFFLYLFIDDHVCIKYGEKIYMGRLIGCILRHINPCRLFNGKSCLYILNICK